MRKNKTLAASLLLGAMLGVSGCNAISFFPQKAAERAADKVLDDLLPVDGSPDDAAKPTEPEKS